MKKNETGRKDESGKPDGCYAKIGVTTAEPVITLGDDTAKIDELLSLNESVLEDVYPTRTPAAGAVVEAVAAGSRTTQSK